jgi:hypothetical protein
VSAKVPETQNTPAFPGSSFKYGPLQHVRVLLTSFIQGLFAAAPKGCYRWAPDINTTELVVQGEEVLDPELLGKRPGISVTRGPIQFYNMGLDDLEQYRFDNEQKTKGVLIPGTMSINCCSSEALESEQLAWVVGEHVWLLRDLLMKQGFFEIGRSISIGAPSPAGSIIAGDMGEEYFCTALSVPFQFARLSAFTPLGKQVVHSIETQLNVRTGRSVVPDGHPYANHHQPLSYCVQRPESFAPEAQDVPGHQSDATQYMAPHPLNPAVTVRVKVYRPFSPRNKVPPHSNVTAVPITPGCVEESTATTPSLVQKG